MINKESSIFLETQVNWPGSLRNSLHFKVSVDKYHLGFKEEAFHLQQLRRIIPTPFSYCSLF